MNFTAGSLLISTPLMDDANFEKTVLLITEYNKNGATGFIINKLFARKLNELIEFRNDKPFELYIGGPVEKEQLYFIHNRSDIIENGTLICNNIYLGGNFKQAIQHINQSNTSQQNVKLFIGYCGWDAEQLEAEIAAREWLVVETNLEKILSHPNAMSWDDLYLINSI